MRPQSEIADGVHWLEDRFVNNYIIVDDDELILIDTAMNKKAKGIFEYIREELSDMKVAKIFLTHHHMDHTGGLHHLHSTFHPPVYVGEQDADVVTGARKMPLPRPWYMKPIFYVLRSFLTPKRVDQVELIHDGMNIDQFKVYHLPGHTMGSMGFLKGNTMFSGDSAVTDNGKVNPGTNAFAESIPAAHNSVRKLAKLNFDMILPGHGTPILEDAIQRVKDAADKLPPI